VISSSLVLLAAVLAVLLAVGSYFLLSQKTVVIDIDGQRVILHTRQATVGGALDEAGLILAPQDALAPGLLSALQNGMTVEVRRARTVLVEADGQVITLRTRQTVPATLLAEAGIALGSHDLLRADGRPVSDAALPLAEPPVYLEVIRAAALTIDDGGRVYTVYTTAPTVGAALDDLGMVLYLADRVDPPPESPGGGGVHLPGRRGVAGGPAERTDMRPQLPDRGARGQGALEVTPRKRLRSLGRRGCKGGPQTRSRLTPPSTAALSPGAKARRVPQRDAAGVLRRA
jgi:hypothetical protein